MADIDIPKEGSEASATAGISAGILKGVEMGILDKTYIQVGRKALKTLTEFIDEDGRLHQVSIGTPLGPDKDFYKKIPLAPMGYGQALGMLYLIQCLKTY